MSMVDAGVEKKPFHKALVAALTALMQSQPLQRRMAKDWWKELNQPRYTEGQVKAELIWMANRQIVKVQLTGQTNWYWAEPKEE